jgi:hypothetical protein
LSGGERRDMKRAREEKGERKRKENIFPYVCLDARRKRKEKQWNKYCTCLVCKGKEKENMLFDLYALMDIFDILQYYASIFKISRFTSNFVKSQMSHTWKIVCLVLVREKKKAKKCVYQNIYIYII